LLRYGSAPKITKKEGAVHEESRKKHSPAFKAKVALEMLKGEEGPLSNWPASFRFTAEVLGDNS
jgi:hypothetical protein